LSFRFADLEISGLTKAWDNQNWIRQTIKWFA